MWRYRGRSKQRASYLAWPYKSRTSRSSPVFINWNGLKFSLPARQREKLEREGVSEQNHTYSSSVRVSERRRRSLSRRFFRFVFRNGGSVRSWLDSVFLSESLRALQPRFRRRESESRFAAEASKQDRVVGNRDHLHEWMQIG